MTENSHRGSILVVDDTPANLKLLSDLLKRQNYAVRAARSGPVAFMSAQSNPPELILLDVSMPDMDGYEVAQRLKGDDATRDIPIVFISALNETDDIVRAFEVGGADYITKPFKFKEVLARVENHLTLARQRREIERLREREKQRFEMLNQLRDQFVGGATHDLKNPLAAVRGYLHMLETQTEVDIEKKRYYLEQIHRSIDKMGDLISDMLDYYRVESHDVLNLRDTSLQMYLPHIITDFELQAQAGQITLTAEIHPGTSMVQIDNKRFSRVIENLVSNALKYTPEGGAVRIAAYDCVESDHVCIEIEDTGLGIPENALKDIFTPFFRVKSKEHKKVAGTGLGLSVVKAIVEQHQGTIKIESVEGEGTRIRLILPRIATLT